LHQLGVAVRLYADENEGRLPRAGAFAQTGTNAAGALPGIQEVFSPQLRGARAVFKCPADKNRLFVSEGSSYEWNDSLNGRILYRIGQDRSGEESTRTFLLRDREGWHPRGRKNAVFADGHAGPENL